MHLENLTVTNYRNIENARCEFSRGVNVLWGENGQGKTNMLEAVWMLTGAKSFRTNRNAELVRFSQKCATIESEFFAQERTQHMQLDITSDARTATLNGVKKAQLSEIIGTLCAVVFSPEHLELVRSGASARRRFVDLAICQIKPSFAKTLVKYNHTLAQRNNVIKKLRNEPVRLANDLVVWNMMLAGTGAEIARMRADYISRLSKFANSLYAMISGEREQLRVTYSCCFAREFEEGNVIDDEQLFERMMTKLETSFEADVNAGYTTAGVHRDDMVLSVDSHSARNFASQGQKRSVVLALKLAEAELMSSWTGEMPVVLLDDVLSELDEMRQNFLLSRLEGQQIIITCCDPSPLAHFDGRVFEIGSGSIIG